jgi:acetylornithine deacetylase/succinyl-diaminopimelate desuccinylase-like protein
MMIKSNILNQYLDENQNRFIDELSDLLRIPSISTLSDHKRDVNSCADLVKMYLLKSGCTHAEVLQTNGNPVVYGEVVTDSNRPTVLVYGHYDVVPPDPMGPWETEPFQPVLKDGRIYARGASDDKGQFFVHLKAMETLIRTGTLQTNIKFLIEGEEEIGSPGLKAFLSSHDQLLQADVMLVSDGSMLGRETPSIETGFRGICALDLEITGSNRELHSGIYGGSVINPVTVMAKILASFHDSENHITIPGFYDDVSHPDDDQYQLQNSRSINEREYAMEIGAKELWGEEGFSVIERTTTRPTLEINGIKGGYTGEGTKSIIPSRALAKISSRLVPDQSSTVVSRLICDFVKSITPSAVDLKIVCHPGCEPYTIDVNDPFFKLACRAIEDIYKSPPIHMKDGGSLPLCNWIENKLGITSILMGFGLQEDNIHGPNESLALHNFRNGIRTILKFHEYLGRGI